MLWATRVTLKPSAFLAFEHSNLLTFLLSVKMPILVSSKRGETRAAALKRAKENYVGRALIYEGNDGEDANQGGYPEVAGDIMNEYNNDKMKVLRAINMMRVPWGNKITKAIHNCEIAKNINREMSSPGGLAKYVSPIRLMMTAEAKLGHVYSLDDNKRWIIEKYYSVVSNLENSEWNRGSTAGATFTDEVNLSPTTDITYVNIDRSNFCETRRLGITAGEVMAQDMAEADRLARAMKFPKSREGLSPNQRRAISDVMKLANNGQNHLTRLVRGVLLSLGADMSSTGKILLKNDKNKFSWNNYVPETIEAVHSNAKSCAIWCTYPSRQDYASIIVHFTQAWCCEGMPLRINSVRIPSDAEFTYVVSLGAGDLHDVSADGDIIRGALTSYAQSMGCEDILEQAYCIGSMLIMHEHWPAVHLPASLWASDLIRPAMATKHEVSRHKREWKLRECIVLAKYAADVLGLMIKEIMSSGWEHNTEKIEDVVSRISRGQKIRRDEMYRWVIENITGEGSGYIFNLDPLKNIDVQRVKRVNDTSILKYWWIGEVRGVGGDSLCSALLCSDYTTIPSTSSDTATAREIGFLRQLGVVTNGPLYKREVRLRKINVDQDKKKIIDGCIKEGRVSVVPSGISTHIFRKRGKVNMDDWTQEKEESDNIPYDDEDVVYEEKPRKEDDNGEDSDEEYAPEEMSDYQGKTTEATEKKENTPEEEDKTEQDTTINVDENKEEDKNGNDNIQEEDEKDHVNTEKEKEEEEIKQKEREEEVKSRHEGVYEEKQNTDKDTDIQMGDSSTSILGKPVGDRIIYPDTYTESSGRKASMTKSKTVIEKKEIRSDRIPAELFDITLGKKESLKPSGDKEMLSELFDSDENARKSEFWQSLKEKWVLESEFILQNWRKRKLKPDVILRCCNLMREIYPVTSLHTDTRLKGKAEIVRASGMMVGLISMGSEEPGEWDRNHFILQCWGWNYFMKWYDAKLGQKISDAAKDIAAYKNSLTQLEVVRYEMWAKNEFGCLPELLAHKKRAILDQNIRIKHERKVIMHICKELNFRPPPWEMYDVSGDSREILTLLGLPVIGKKFKLHPNLS